MTDNTPKNGEAVSLPGIRQPSAEDRQRAVHLKKARDTILGAIENFDKMGQIWILKDCTAYVFARWFKGPDRPGLVRKFNEQLEKRIVELERNDGIPGA